LSRLDRGVVRFLAWIVAATSVVLLLFQGQLTTFFFALNGRLNDTFGTAFPAIPFAALLAVLFLLRWEDLHAALLREQGPASRPATRLFGLSLVVVPLLLSQYSVGSLELSAASLIMAFYGTALAINPGSARLLLPYALLYLGGVTVPAGVVYLFGEPLAGFSAGLSADLLALTGVPISWHGTQFVLVSRAGGSITGVITPGCSSVLSVTTFLGLLGLMYFDFRKDLGPTLGLAVGGSAVLVLLNSVRIGVLIWAGYDGGPAALWGLHNWVGYAIFVGFYLGILWIYSGLGRHQGVAPGATVAGGAN